MPQITFLDDAITVKVADGTRLLDAVDEAGATLEAGCRSAHCGKCRVRIVSGADTLSPASTKESQFLKTIGAHNNERLGCQIKIHGDCTVEYVGP
jgi:nitrite reductase (NADH) large subunit